MAYLRRSSGAEAAESYALRLQQDVLNGAQAVGTKGEVLNSLFVVSCESLMQVSHFMTPKSCLRTNLERPEDWEWQLEASLKVIVFSTSKNESDLLTCQAPNEDPKNSRLVEEVRIWHEVGTSLPDTG